MKLKELFLPLFYIFLIYFHPILSVDEKQGVSETLEGSVSNAESVQIDSASLKGVFGEESESDKEEGSANKYSRKSLVKSLSDGSLRESPQRKEMLKRKSFNAEESSQKMVKLEEEEENRRKRLKLNFDDEREKKEKSEIERKGKRIVKEEEDRIKKIFGATSEIEEMKDKKDRKDGPSEIEEIEVRNENDGRESYTEIEGVKDGYNRGGVSEIEEVGDENGGRGRVSEIEEMEEVREEHDGRESYTEIEEVKNGYSRGGVSEIEEVGDENSGRGRVSEIEEEIKEVREEHDGRGFSEIEEEDDIEEEEEGLRRRGRYRRGGGRVTEIEKEEEYNGRFLPFRRVTEIEVVDDDEAPQSPDTPQSPDYLEKREKAKFQFKKDWTEFKKVLIEWEERIVWKSNYQHVLEKERDLKKKDREINREALDGSKSFFRVLFICVAKSSKVLSLNNGPLTCTD